MRSLWSHWSLFAALLAVVPVAVSAQPRLADPTRPPQAIASHPGIITGDVSTPSHSWRLTSILISAERRMAVINGRIVSSGQYIDGAVLLDVQPNAVKLRQGSRIFSLTLAARGVKKIANGTDEEL